MQSPIRIDNGQVAVEIAALGAEMQSIMTADGASWLWHGDAAFWGGRAPVLFPIVGKAPNDQLGIDGQQYGMGQHGFARRSVFALETAGTDSCQFVLEADDTTRAVYPFEFRLSLEYRLVGAGVMVTSTVSNTGAVPMPFQLGYHPAFAWPLPGAEGAVHEIRLSGDAAPALQRLHGGLLAAQRQPSPFKQGRLRLDHAQFEEDAMIFPEGCGERLVYGVEGGSRIEFSWSGLPNLALWTKPGAPFICIEPWHGTAAREGGSDDIAQRPYVMALKPGASKAFSYTAVFKR
ncbi:aldose 1-epimerase family protein [Devosia sp.]|uniref:aldose 1-epimerase family protein n=1 Tax=Devosia sp. TaxID=1871048 RepID=UPI0032642577